MAPRVGFEPTTGRLTVVCSTTELPRTKRSFDEQMILCQSKIKNPPLI